MIKKDGTGPIAQGSRKQNLGLVVIGTDRCKSSAINVYAKQRSAFTRITRRKYLWKSYRVSMTAFNDCYPSCSCMSCLGIRPYPIRLANEDRIPLLDRQCSWLATSDGLPMTGSRTAGATRPALQVASRYRVLDSPIRTCKWWQNFICRVRSIRERYLQRKAERQHRAWPNQTQSLTDLRILIITLKDLWTSTILREGQYTPTVQMENPDF